MMDVTTGPPEAVQVPRFDVTRPNIARVYDYLLGGKDNYAADREEAERILKVCPPMAELARENRQFLGRAVTWVAQQGIRQFLDVGSGLPTGDNTHQAVQAVDPDARVVYVDNDPVVLSHATALLASPGGDGVEAIHGDLRDPMGILGDPIVRKMIRPSEPACVVLAMVLHFFDFETAREIASAFVRWPPPGSYAVISVGIGDEQTGNDLIREYKAAPLFNHSPEQVARFFGDLKLVPPGLVDAGYWRPGWTVAPSGHRGGRILAAVARKPLERRRGTAGRFADPSPAGDPCTGDYSREPSPGPEKGITADDDSPLP